MAQTPYQTYMVAEHGSEPWPSNEATANTSAAQVASKSIYQQTEPFTSEVESMRDELKMVNGNLAKVLTKLTNLERDINENVGRQVMTNVKANYLVSKVERLIGETAQEEPLKRKNSGVSCKEGEPRTSYVAERQSCMKDQITTEDVTVENGNVKAVIGLKGNTINRIKEATKARKIELNDSKRVFTITGCPASIVAAKKMIMDIASGNLACIGETSTVINIPSSKVREVI
jgi:hypothetical protein